MKWNDGRNYIGQFKKNLFHGYVDEHTGILTP